MSKPASLDDDDRYDVDVWDCEGNVVKCFRDISADEVDEVQDRYADEPLLTVVVHDR